MNPIFDDGIIDSKNDSKCLYEYILWKANRWFVLNYKRLSQWLIEHYPQTYINNELVDSIQQYFKNLCFCARIICVQYKQTIIYYNIY